MFKPCVWRKSWTPVRLTHIIWAILRLTHNPWKLVRLTHFGAFNQYFKLKIISVG